MPPESRKPAKSPAVEAGYDSISAIKIFHKKDSERAPLTSIGLLPMPPDYPVPGFVFQAARHLLDVTQEWLRRQAKISRKTVNDFEKGAIEPSAGIMKKLRQALEKEGARFVSGDDVIGVVVYSSIERISETRDKEPAN